MINLGIYYHRSYADGWISTKTILAETPYTLVVHRLPPVDGEGGRLLLQFQPADGAPHEVDETRVGIMLDEAGRLALRDALIWQAQGGQSCKFS